MTNAVRQMMSGFGDNRNPRPETVRLMEELVLDYITALVGKVSFIFLYPAMLICMCKFGV